ncbi:hypothetical protein ISN45_At05g028830 [Arabidopsis thaliana x Arabidopsis arenosa]|uniref:Arabidopsis retrotransposon Orf1 C-terminal domain-containing protein n=1 Tax=Arabidopsis thaliana x Arabidopsis arenosa TaxID=1240361 RepID=A0A8T2CW61_9BRAS|nr:hypothetical protein ISN45_At05g028830 [Arabidopsis thaliana x Arabidopsis arenosa]
MGRMAPKSLDQGVEYCAGCTRPGGRVTLFSETTQYDGVDRYPSSVDRHWIRTAPCEIHAAKCTTIMEKILHTLPKDASKTFSSSVNRYVKRLFDNGISSNEAKLLTRDISAIMLLKAKKEKAKRVDIAEYICTITPGQTTEKLPDPGSFVLDCSISKSRFNHSLCYMGSSINLMPKSVSERLGMTHYRSTHYRPTRITLLFADRSKRFPEGILEDIPVKVCDLEMEFGIDGSELTKPTSSIASSTDTPPQNAQNQTTEPYTALPSVQLANESCRATMSIDTTTLVDRHPRVSQTEDSTHSLQPTPLEDICDKFSSLSSLALLLINSLDSLKFASQDNKPRVARKLVSPVILAGDEISVDRHTLECRSTPLAASTKSVRVNPTIGKSRWQTNRLEDILVSNSTTKVGANLTALPFTSSNGILCNGTTMEIRRHFGARANGKEAKDDFGFRNQRAFVSLMPLSKAKRLGVMEYKFCNLALLLADGSVAHPHGLKENLPAKIRNVEIPTDFVVLDIDEEGKDPLILGRPFLASVGAVIDVKNGNIDLNLEKCIKMEFDISNASGKPRMKTLQKMTGVPKQPINPSSKEEHLNFDSVAEELLEHWTGYQAQEDTIGKLTHKMKELNSTILELQEMIKSYPNFEIEDWSKEPGIEEEDYFTDQKEAYFEEKSNEYSSFHMSREDAEFPSREEIRQDYDKDELLSLWAKIVSPKPYSSTKSKSSAIRSPVIRYLHQCIANTLFPKKTTGFVDEGELCMLDQALVFILRETKDGRKMAVDRADTSLNVVLLDHLMSYREYATTIHRSGIRGSLCVGVLLTPILGAVGIHLGTPDVHPKYLDLDYLRGKDYLDKTTSVEFEQHGEPPEQETNEFKQANFEEGPDQGKDEIAEVHKKLAVLEELGNLQSKTMKGFKKNMKTMKKSLTGMAAQIKDFQSKPRLPSPTPKERRSGSTSSAARRADRIAQPRASSFEPREVIFELREPRSRQRGASIRSTN